MIFLFLVEGPVITKKHIQDTCTKILTTYANVIRIFNDLTASFFGFNFYIQILKMCNFTEKQLCLNQASALGKDVNPAVEKILQFQLIFTEVLL
jgi:hypothetical protein